MGAGLFVIRMQREVAEEGTRKARVSGVSPVYLVMLSQSSSQKD
jgi:hypothetical protein